MEWDQLFTTFVSKILFKAALALKRSCSMLGKNSDLQPTSQDNQELVVGCGKLVSAKSTLHALRCLDVLCDDLHARDTAPLIVELFQRVQVYKGCTLFLPRLLTSPHSWRWVSAWRCAVLAGVDWRYSALLFQKRT